MMPCMKVKRKEVLRHVNIVMVIGALIAGSLTSVCLDVDHAGVKVASLGCCEPKECDKTQGNSDETHQVNTPCDDECECSNQCTDIQLVQCLLPITKLIPHQLIPSVDSLMVLHVRIYSKPAFHASNAQPYKIIHSELIRATVILI